MGKVMVVGCGGVAGVAIHKICQNSDCLLYTSDAADEL